MCAKAASAGAIARQNTVLRQRSITALCAGRGAAYMGKPLPGACWERAIHCHADDRLHARQGSPLGGRGERGEQKQAVGRSRGGRNTKIQALADAKGRLLAILLTGGEAVRVLPPGRPKAERTSAATAMANGKLPLISLIRASFAA